MPPGTFSTPLLAWQTSRLIGDVGRLLQQWRKQTHHIDAPPETVYFVGDTPESDIRGTNDYNEESDQLWYSILVKTGVFKEGTKPKYAPKAIVDNVLEAVRHGMEREMKQEIRNDAKRSGDLTGAGVSPIPEICVEDDPIAEKGAEIKAEQESNGHDGDANAKPNGSANGTTNGNTNGVH